MATLMPRDTVIPRKARPMEDGEWLGLFAIDFCAVMSMPRAFSFRDCFTVGWKGCMLQSPPMLGAEEEPVPRPARMSNNMWLSRYEIRGLSQLDQHHMW